MKRSLVLLTTAALIVSLVSGCSTPEKPAESQSSAATSAASSSSSVSQSASSASSESSAALTLPTTGIGRQIATTVKAKKTYKIACIVKNSTNPYMLSQLQGVKKAGQDEGFEAILMAPAKQDSVEEQVKIIEDMIQKKVDGIIVHCVDSNGIMPGIRKAKEANIPVVTIGTPAAEPTFLRTGVNYEETGYEVAKKLAEQLKGKGQMIILEGPAGAQNAKERLAGINRALKDYPDIKVVASQTANFKRTEGMNVTENLLQKYKDINAIIGCNDESALGAIQALKAAGMKDVLVGGFDGSSDASAAIAAGDMLVSYNTDPYGSGYLAATYLTQFLNDGTMPAKLFMPFPSANDKPLITKDNVKDYSDTTAWWKATK
jgi:ABC-type sugar transport system substrate-binding protein